MNSVIFLVLRRMRTPLLVLVMTYAVSISGLVLIPGVDPEGNTWRFSFFHAFYFISYTASTIGFGEVPYTFTDGQRMWVTLSMYLTVIGWLYAIGNILALIQDPAFKRAIIEQRFTRSVRRLKRPFHLVCGHGETGSLLVRALDRRGFQTVVIDIDPDHLNEVSLADLSHDVPHLVADARDVDKLIEAGLTHSHCRAVLALTDIDSVNVKVAIAAKLLNPGVTVVCRAESKEAAVNMASFDTDHIINPFQTFADHLAMALHAPSVHLLYDWLISRPNLPLHPLLKPPRGAWVVCGFGRFGREVKRFFSYEGLPTTIIEVRPDQAPEGAIIGRGTEAVTLREAGIDKAVGIVAGTDSDPNNLSIIMTARAENPDLYLIARQNLGSNGAIFQAANLDLVMQASRVTVWRILPLLTVPLLSRFLRQARHRNEQWAGELLDRIRAVCLNRTPETWSITIDRVDAEAVQQALEEGRDIRLKHLLGEPQDRSTLLPCVPLLLIRGNEEVLLPDGEQGIHIGDRLLFTACAGAAGRMAWTLENPNVLEYVETGLERPDGYIWRWLERWRTGRVTG
ncbi:MAG: NAD-binding protein [Candidatus Competibacteraceae bacterium]|nr:NAD-binding protein [Candidatus Competibacteraceae bacterium]